MNQLKTLAMLDAFLTAWGMGDRVYERMYGKLVRDLYSAAEACRAVQATCFLLALGDPNWVQVTDEDIVQANSVKYNRRGTLFGSDHTDPITHVAQSSWKALGLRLERGVESGDLPAQAIDIYHGKVRYEPQIEKESSDDPTLF